MIRTAPWRAIERADIPALFHTINDALAQKRQTAHITVVGGFAILLQGFRERATLDIDITAGHDATLFAATCATLNIPVDIVTIASTVDLTNTKTITKYTGKHLTVDTVLAEDLIRMKLERFTKHDPEDIYAIIDHTKLSYAQFATVVQEMLIDYIGRPQELRLSAQLVVERKYPEQLTAFATAMKRWG